MAANAADREPLAAELAAHTSTTTRLCHVTLQKNQFFLLFFFSRDSIR